MLRRILSSPPSPSKLACLAVLLCAPALGVGWLADDHMHRAKVHGHPSLPDATPVAAEMFVFLDGTVEGNRALGDAGVLAWWAAPEVKASFLRPLTALTHQLDYAVWPRAPWLMHLHSLLWLALLVAAATVLFRRTAGASAPLAALLFALDDGHALPATWIANRNALVALVFCVAALVLHHTWRRSGRTWGAPAAVLCFACGLAASEAAYGVTGYLFAYALFVDRGRVAHRIASLAPYLVAAVAWLVVLHALDFGTAGADTYVDPVGDPLGFGQAVIERVPVLLLAQWVGVPSDLWIVLPRGVQIGWTVAGWLLVVAMAWVSLPLLRRDGVMRMWACGMVLALIPVCAAFPMDRLLLFASLGAAGLIAGLAGYAGYPDGERRQGLVRWVVIALLVLHLPISALLTPAKVVHTSLTLRMFDALDSRLPEDPQLAEQQVVLINGVEFMGFYARLLREESGRPAPAGFDWLAHPLMQMEITRSGDHTLTIRPEGGYLSNAAQALCRSPSIPFTRGQVIERSFVTVTIDELTDDHRPAVVTFLFPTPLEDPSLRWFVWKAGDLEPFEPPAIGETVTVGPTFPTLF